MATADSDSEELIRLTAAGNRNARDQLLQRYRSKLKRMVEIRIDPRLTPRIDASDVVQEALAEAADKLDQFVRERPIPIYSWLRQFTWNHLVNLHRQHFAQKRDVSREQVWALSEQSAHDLAGRLFVDTDNVARNQRHQDVNRRIRDLLGRLKEVDREILILRHLEGMSTQEIAATVGLSESAVKKRQVRALLKLRNQTDGNSGSL